MGYVYLAQLSNIISITAIFVRVDFYVYIKLLFIFFFSGLFLLIHNLVYNVCQPLPGTCFILPRWNIGE